MEEDILTHLLTVMFRGTPWGHPVCQIKRICREISSDPNFKKKEMPDSQRYPLNFFWYRL